MELDYSKDKSVKSQLRRNIRLSKDVAATSINLLGVISLPVHDILVEPFVDKLGPAEIGLADGLRMNKKKKL